MTYRINQYENPNLPTKDVLVRVVPGQDEAMWREIVRLAVKLPGPMGEVRSEVMSEEEAIAFKGLASCVVVDPIPVES